MRSNILHSGKDGKNWTLIHVYKTSRETWLAHPLSSYQEQSKRALQLDWQQKKLNLSNNSSNQAKQDTSAASAAAMDEMMGTDLSLSNVDFDMAFDSTTDGMGGSGAADSNELQKDEPMEEDDMEELLQAQRERLDRLRSLLIHRVDAESLTANQGDMGGNDDLLF